MKLHKNPRFIYRYHCIGFYQKYPIAISLPCHIFNRYQRKIVRTKRKNKRRKHIYLPQRDTNEKTTEKSSIERVESGWESRLSRDDPGCVYLYGPGDQRSYLLAGCAQWVAGRVLCTSLYCTMLYSILRTIGRLAGRNRECLYSCARIQYTHIQYTHIASESGSTTGKAKTGSAAGGKQVDSERHDKACSPVDARGVLLWGCVLLIENPLHLRTRRSRLIDGLFYVEESIMRSFGEMMERNFE